MSINTYSEFFLFQRNSQVTGVPLKKNFTGVCLNCSKTNCAVSNFLQLKTILLVPIIKPVCFLKQFREKYKTEEKNTRMNMNKKYKDEEKNRKLQTKIKG